MEQLSIHFHGVRGSIAAPGVATARVGGNTSCVEVRAGEHRIVLDAGTGLRALGERLIATGPTATTILLSHLHWDHIQGLPFFTPIYVSGNWIEVVCGPNGTMPLEAALRRQMSAPFFPVDFEDVSRQVRAREPRIGEPFAIGDVRVTMAKLNHPDPVFGYRLEHRGASVVYATDTEHFACVDPALARLAAGADVLIYDAQYTPEEYPGKVGWGHSTWEAAVALARTAGVRQLVLYHHDPRRSDDAIDVLEARAQAAFPGTVAAREGAVLQVEPRSTRKAA
ncbi:MAG: MBL fold metallo-hydrolase [Deltaproteobacteria bacterium]|nr:MBL fold metallo-hydrolase [Kofleriaceae bacterium]